MKDTSCDDSRSGDTLDVGDLFDPTSDIYIYVLRVNNVCSWQHGWWKWKKKHH